MADSLDVEWLRPSFHWTPSPNEAPINFQYLDIDHYEAPKRPGSIGPDNGIVPVVRMYGVTEDGERMLDQTVKSRYHIPRTDEMVLEVDCVSGKSFLGASGDDKHYFLKIIVATPRAIGPVKNVFAKGGLESMDVYVEGAMHQERRHIFEANIDFITRFLCDLDIRGTSWIELPIKKYHLREKDCISHCQLECDINYTDLIAHPPRGRWANIVPFRILSFDIETAVGFGFPRPEKQQVIQISNIVIKHGHKRPFLTTIFTLRSCAPIENAVVKSYDSEPEMLMAWSKFVIAIDPDIMTGYNIYNFDTYYLIRRAEVLGLTKFPYLGRIKSVASKKRPKGSAPPYNMEGRIQFDLMRVVMLNHGEERLKGFKLNMVAEHFLEQEKDDVHYTEIMGLFNGTAEDRRRLAVYCIKDSQLVLDLIEELDCIENHFEAAIDTGAPVNHILASKQPTSASTTIAQLLREARERNQLLPDVQVSDTRSNRFIIIE